MEAVLNKIPGYGAELANLVRPIYFIMENLYALHRRVSIVLFVVITVSYFMLNVSFNLMLNTDVSQLNVLLYSFLGYLAICALGGVYYVLTSKGNWWVGLLGLLIAFVLLTKSSHWLIYDIFPQFGHSAYQEISRTYKEFVVLSIPRFYYYSIAALCFVFVVRYGKVLIAKIETDREKDRLEVKTLQADNKALAMELRAYGAYMNPHFLFNELKDIKGELQGFRDPNAAHLARRIDTLEGIANYNAANVAEERRIVVVERELEQLERYLHARHNANGSYPKTVLDIQGEPAGHKIVPMVLVFLAENAYTHGDLRTAPLAIRIELRDDALKAVFRNRIPAEKPKAQSLGSGLEITRRRLELAMPQRFSLVVSEEKDEFYVTLIIHQ